MLCVLYLLFADFFLAEHKTRRTRTICTFVGVPRTRVRRTEYLLKRSESGVPKRGGGYSLLDGNVPRRPSYGVYISRLIRFARVCSHVDDFNTRNKCLTAKLLKQGYRYHKVFSKFFRRHYELISKFNDGLKSLKYFIFFTSRPIGTKILW